MKLDVALQGAAGTLADRHLMPFVTPLNQRESGSFYTNFPVRVLGLVLTADTIQKTMAAHFGDARGTVPSVI